MKLPLSCKDMQCSESPYNLIFGDCRHNMQTYVFSLVSNQIAYDKFQNEIIIKFRFPKLRT
jgi:hypothetical protein